MLSVSLLKSGLETFSALHISFLNFQFLFFLLLFYVGGSSVHRWGLSQLEYGTQREYATIPLATEEAPDRQKKLPNTAGPPCQVPQGRPWKVFPRSL